MASARDGGMSVVVFLCVYPSFRPDESPQRTADFEISGPDNTLPYEPTRPRQPESR